MSRQRVAVLGATGSIGGNTLDVLARHPERFEVVALTAATQVEALLRQCEISNLKWPFWPIRSVPPGCNKSLPRVVCRPGSRPAPRPWWRRPHGTRWTP